jgi:hypothetical protein
MLIFGQRHLRLLETQKHGAETASPCDTRAASCRDYRSGSPELNVQSTEVGMTFTALCVNERQAARTSSEPPEFLQNQVFTRKLVCSVGQAHRHRRIALS